MRFTFDPLVEAYMNIVITPIFLVLAAIIGLLIGLLVANIVNSRESKSGAEKAPPEDLAKDGFTRAAQIWYSPAGKKIVTEMDGEFYRDFLVLSPDQKKRILRIIGLWSAWSGNEPALSAEKTESAAPESPRAVQGEASSMQPIPPMQDFTAAAEEPAQAKTDTSLTIAGQISNIIARMIENHPLREKGIKLIENQQHGVDVWVGMEKFDGIDSIPYPEVQQFIRAAVEEWEQQSEQKNLFQK